MSANRSASPRDAINKTAASALLGSPFETNGPVAPTPPGDSGDNSKGAPTSGNTPEIRETSVTHKENPETDSRLSDTPGAVEGELGSAPPPLDPLEVGKENLVEDQDEDELGGRLDHYKRPRYRDTHTSRSYYIENDLLDQFDEFCEKYELDKSMMVNDALRQHLKNLKQSKKRK